MQTESPITREQVVGGRAISGRLVACGLLSVAVASLALAVPPLRGVAAQLTHLSPGWIAAAIALELASCVGFVVIFRLFFDRVPGPLARQIAWVEQGSGALLPGGGVGALAIGAWFLRRSGMSMRVIVDRSSALFFLTSAINVAALVGGGLWLAFAGGRLDDVVRTAIPIAGGLTATAAVLAIPYLIRRFRQRYWPAWLVDVSAGIVRARRSLRRPDWRLAGALAYLGCDIAALGAAIAATGRPLGVAPLTLGYLLGYLANLVPIPGGFGVLEGGLAGALIAYGTPATQAAAAVILYHAIAFWIPTLGGVAAYALLRRRLHDVDAAACADDHRPHRDARSSATEPVLVRAPCVLPANSGGD